MATKRRGPSAPAWLPVSVPVSVPVSAPASVSVRESRPLWVPQETAAGSRRAAAGGPQGRLAARRWRRTCWRQRAERRSQKGAASRTRAEERREMVEAEQDVLREKARSRKQSCPAPGWAPCDMRQRHAACHPVASPPGPITTLSHPTACHMGRRRGARGTLARRPTRRRPNQPAARDRFWCAGGSAWRVFSSLSFPFLFFSHAAPPTPHRARTTLRLRPRGAPTGPRTPRSHRISVTPHRGSAHPPAPPLTLRPSRVGVVRPGPAACCAAAAPKGPRSARRPHPEGMLLRRAAARWTSTARKDLDSGGLVFPFWAVMSVLLQPAMHTPLAPTSRHPTLDMTSESRLPPLFNRPFFLGWTQRCRIVQSPACTERTDASHTRQDRGGCVTYRGLACPGFFEPIFGRVAGFDVSAAHHSSGYTSFYSAILCLVGCRPVVGAEATSSHQEE